MGIRDNLQKLVDRKRQEIDELERQLRDAKVYLQAVQDSMKALPREVMVGNEQTKELRPGTIVAKVRDLLKSTGKPLHINDILKGVGKPADKKNKLSLSGSLAAYVRDNQIFTRTAPNTFGLTEFLGNGSAPNKTDDDIFDDIPEDFGKV